VVKIFKYVMVSIIMDYWKNAARVSFSESKDLTCYIQQEMYEEVDDMLYELNHGYNSLNDVFNVKVVNRGSSHYKSTFIHDPW
jgi:hypothetical protein